MSRHFLFCIPVRFGVFVMSISMLLTSLAAAGFSIFFLQHILRGDDAWIGTINVPIGYKVALGVSAGINVIVAIVSLFGLLGAIIRKRSFVKSYSVMLWFFWVISLIGGIALIAGVFLNKTRTKLQEVCDKIPQDVIKQNPNAVQECKDWVVRIKDARFLVPFIVYIVLTLLWHLYGCVIVRRYVKQLEEEQAYRAYTQDPAFNTSRPKSYYPHEAVSQQTEPLTAAQGPYPYADPHHGFGGKNA